MSALEDVRFRVVALYLPAFAPGEYWTIIGEVVLKNLNNLLLWNTMYWDNEII